jgi:hypothetical protein
MSETPENVDPAARPAGGQDDALAAHRRCELAQHVRVDVATFLDGFGPVLTPEQVGTAIADLVIDPGHDQGAYMLTAAGLSPVP